MAGPTEAELFTLGATTIQKIHELDLNGFTLAQLLPAVDEHLPQRHPDWLPTGTIEKDHALLSVHSWLVRHEGKVILIDAGAGNDKARPQQPVLDHLSNPFLDRLADAGITPEMVDYVIHTHIHSDHVGWNTRLADGKWRPTFPNATTICSRLEWDYGAALADGNEKGIAEAREQAGFGDPIRIPVSGTFNDSMRPLLATGRVRLVDVSKKEELLPGIRFLPTPGHSIDHAAIELIVDGRTAIFGGDVAHHPLELYDSGLVSIFCEFPEAARRSRRALLERAAERTALYFSAHFPLSSAGRVSKKNGDYAWAFLEEGDS
ncbi:MAG: MBL fold metallo-hydrolase [Acidobacteriota bacterium]|nr:MBL fold metallo-hydrolase [Acidobacteriota bacterium]